MRRLPLQEIDDAYALIQPRHNREVPLPVLALSLLLSFVPTGEDHTHVFAQPDSQGLHRVVLNVGHERCSRQPRRMQGCLMVRRHRSLVCTCISKRSRRERSEKRPEIGSLLACLRLCRARRRSSCGVVANGDV